MQAMTNEPLTNQSLTDAGSLTGAVSMAPVVPELATLQPGDPLKWLLAGWRDTRNTRFAGVVYGCVFVLMGVAISAIYQTQWQLTMGLIGGFFLAGPVFGAGGFLLLRPRRGGGEPRPFLFQLFEPPRSLWTSHPLFFL